MAKEEDLKRVELKVSVNCCEGCRRKVLKAVSIKGVLKTEIHPTLPKITVTGNVDARTLIKKLAKRGKSAELWPNSETPKQDKEEKKSQSIAREKEEKQSESTANKTGKSVKKEKPKESNENQEKQAEPNQEENKSNSSNAPKDNKVRTTDNEKEDVQCNKNNEDATMPKDAKSSYQTVVTAIPQVNYLTNPNAMSPHIQGYYPIPPTGNAYPVPYYAMNAYSAPPPSCCIHDRCHGQQPSYQSQQSTGFADYFNDENTVGCHVM